VPPVIPLLVAGGAAAAGTAGTAGAIGGVAGLIGVTSVTTAAIVNAGVGTALVLGASYAMAKLSPTPRQPRPADGTVEYKAPLAPRFFPYGLCKVSGPVLLLELSDSDHRLLKIVAFGSRELAMMDPFYIDGTKITLDAGIAGSDGSFLNWAYGGGSHGGELRTHLGSDTQAADALIMSLASFWTANHRLRGIPYAASEFDSVEAARFQEAFPNGESNFAAVGGVKLYDPRLDTTNGGSGSHRMNDPTTWAFSENQRLACLDWITWKDGYAKDWSRIDWSTWVPQIAMADEDVALKSGATEKRYRIATIVTLTEPKGRVLRRIMDAGDQQLFTTNAGLIGSRGGVWQTPGVSLSAAEILEGQFTHGVGMMDRINEFQLTAMLPSHDYAEVELQPWSNTTDPEFIDGILRSQPLDLTQVPSNSQAQRLAKIRMAKVNPRWSGSIRTNFAGLDALGEAAINLSFDELDQPDGSFDGPFLVNGKIGFLPDRTGMTVSLSSIDPACYDWSSAEEYDAPPLPDAPAMTVAPVVSGSLVTGSVLSCTTGTWAGSPSGYAYQWKRGAVGIVGATSSTYTLVTADVGALMSCAVTATNAAGSAYALANTIGPVTGAVPVNSVAPVVSGTPTVGQILTTTNGTWSNSPTGYAYQWKRDATNISGATANSYTLVTADVGAMMSCVVTATNTFGSASTASNALGPVLSFLASIFGAGSGFYPVKPGYVFTDTAGTVAATADGALIACFKPQYGGLPNLTQATSTLRPQLKNAGGGLWYALGDGVDDVWASAATITTATEQLLALALRRAAERAGQQFKVGTASAPIHAINSLSSSGRMTGEFRVGTQYLVSSAVSAFPTATDFVVTSKVTPTTVDLAKDQAAPASAAAVVTAIVNVPLTFSLAANNADRIYGFALYKGTVGTAERSAIVTALGALQGRSI